jgi:hypothetical protein
MWSGHACPHDPKSSLGKHVEEFADRRMPHFSRSLREVGLFLAANVGLQERSHAARAYVIFARSRERFSRNRSIGCSTIRR